ncbi:class I SAM-dependent methyltransferase [Sporolactobacillus laevolacticus]|uniref:Methyltransferase n=1 Tax=Sporolactobacillus laevolacticus DSM 442 TaxID=1395513 RepID=V6IVT2_9BACL|nr:class I SAM-dependent methyltransferase [Sporolactobacillus laevolacticus]EST10621.1 methyltransferase [Sporolactobacillus laevolacticus DSM 442]MDN3956783.1 class I SAM-dependent methyltransferase [Sporolactobacillus laevolacticus]
MNEHYYSEHPHVESNPHFLKTTLRSLDLIFTTDAGVFSKNAIDFGSKLLIETFREPAVPGDLLDMGCGYGPIGITLAKSFPTRRVTMVDINERAVALTEKNVKDNQVEAVVFQSSLFERVSGDFAAIVTNPPIRAGKRVVQQIFTEAHQFLKSQGELWIVIQKKQGAPSALKMLQTLYGRVDVVAKKKGYYILCAKKV